MSRKAFTLVEAIVVAVLIAILASVGVPLLMGYLNDARLDSGRGSIELVGAAIMHAHNRGVTITATPAGWTDIGITDPSDDTWTFSFGALAPNATDAKVQAYAITGTGKKGTLKGNSGTYSPNQTQGNRWTGVFDCFDQ